MTKKQKTQIIAILKSKKEQFETCQNNTDWNKEVDKLIDVVKNSK
jgi:hypothetical protein